VSHTVCDTVSPSDTRHCTGEESAVSLEDPRHPQVFVWRPRTRPLAAAEKWLVSKRCWTVDGDVSSRRKRALIKELTLLDCRARWHAPIFLEEERASVSNIPVPAAAFGARNARRPVRFRGWQDESD
jgi:hypothetical protein